MFNTLSFIWNHPLNQGNRAAALARYVRWQMSCRIAPGKISVPFVRGTSLLVSKGMTGATGNIYCGLHEFQDMAFVMHALRPGDLFADIGANIGSYTILAAGVAGANTISAEPSPATFAHLEANVRHNNLQHLVQAHNVAVGETHGTLRFTSGFDTVNHVVAEAESGVNAVAVPVVPLDELLAGRVPQIMKIDVEGFESSVIRGGPATLKSAGVRGILMELNGSGARYGFDDAVVHRDMLEQGYARVGYNPFTRRLVVGNKPGENSLYVHDIPTLEAVLQAAPRVTINGIEL